MNYIGIDNGVSGTIGIINGDTGYYNLYKTPIKKMLNYQKSKVRYLNRIDVKELMILLAQYTESQIKCLIERPMVNPKRFAATTSALRALEATIIVLEELKIGYEYCDSKAWQKIIFPNYKKGQDLKELSKQTLIRTYPNIKSELFTDGDGIHIARFCQIYYNQNDN